MLIVDDRYTALVRTLTELHAAGSDEDAVIENSIRIALCAADTSSADFDPDHPSIVLHGEEPSDELATEIDGMLASRSSGSFH